MKELPLLSGEMSLFHGVFISSDHSPFSLRKEHQRKPRNGQRGFRAPARQGLRAHDRRRLAGAGVPSSSHGAVLFFRCFNMTYKLHPRDLGTDERAAVLARGLTGITMEHSREILRGVKAEQIGNLGYGIFVGVQQSLCLIDLILQEGVHNGTSRTLFIYVAQRADSEMKLAAQLLKRDLIVDVRLEVAIQIAHEIILEALARAEELRCRFALAVSHHTNEDTLKVIVYELETAHRLILLTLERNGGNIEAVIAFLNQRFHQDAQIGRKREHLVVEELHGRGVAFKGDDKDRGRVDTVTVYSVLLVGLVEDHFTCRNAVQNPISLKSYLAVIDIDDLPKVVGIIAKAVFGTEVVGKHGDNAVNVQNIFER